MQNVKISIAIVGLLTLCGCVFTPPEEDVERQWGDAMRRLNMYGFYPASEDIQPGDVYLHVPPADSNRRNLARFSLIRLASLPLDRDSSAGPRGIAGSGVYEHLRFQQSNDRLQIAPFPNSGGGGASSQTPTSPGSSTTTTTANASGVTTTTSFTARPPASQPSSPRGSGAGQPAQRPSFAIAAANDTSGEPRLRLAAIPSLTVGRVSQAQLGLAGVLGNFGARIGFAQANQTAISIALTNVQELQLDGWRVAVLMNYRSDDLFNRMRAEDLLMFLKQLEPTGSELLRAACNGNTAQLDRAGVAVEVINRVMYAGGIEYSFSRSTEAAIRLAVDLQSTLRGQPQSPVIPSFGAAAAGAPVLATPSAPESAAAAAERLAGLMSAVTGETGSANRAGATANFGMGSFGALALKVNFLRPVAVAAGSRLSLSFFEALRGGAVADRPLPTRSETYRVRRFRAARLFCAANLTGTNETLLRAAFNIGAGEDIPTNLDSDLVPAARQVGPRLAP